MNIEFDCPTCKAKTNRLIAAKDAIGCPLCIGYIKQQNCSGTIVKGVNPHNKNMSYADVMHIKTRTICPDGVVRSAPRWETRDY